MIRVKRNKCAFGALNGYMTQLISTYTTDNFRTSSGELTLHIPPAMGQDCCGVLLRSYVKTDPIFKGAYTTLVRKKLYKECTKPGKFTIKCF